jgi:hypothetical protein
LGCFSTPLFYWPFLKKPLQRERFKCMARVHGRRFIGLFPLPCPLVGMQWKDSLTHVPESFRRISYAWRKVLIFIRITTFPAVRKNPVIHEFLDPGLAFFGRISAKGPVIASKGLHITNPFAIGAPTLLFTGRKKGYEKYNEHQEKPGNDLFYFHG